MIEDAVLLYLEQHAPNLKNCANLTRELAACHSAYAGRPMADLADIAREYPKIAHKSNSKTKLNPATVRNRLAYLRAACRWAWKHHQMGDHDPAERMVLPKARNERHIYLSRAEFLAICRKVRPGSERAAIRIAFYSGMRASEVGLATVMFGEFCLSDTKNGERRIIPVHPKVAHITRNPKLWPIKPTRWTVSTHFKIAARAAGFAGVRLHDVRHSTASEMINAGVDLYTVGAVLGHKSAVSTKRYAHLATATLATALGNVGKRKAV
jgi:integrase